MIYPIENETTMQTINQKDSSLMELNQSHNEPRHPPLATTKLQSITEAYNDYQLSKIYRGQLYGRHQRTKPRINSSKMPKHCKTCKRVYRTGDKFVNESLGRDSGQSKDELENQAKNPHKENLKFCFALFLLLTVWSSFQVTVYFFVGGLNLVKQRVLTAVFAFMIPFNFLYGFYLSDCCKEYFSIVLLLDTFLVTQIAADIGIVGVLMMVNPNNPINIFWMTAFPFYNLTHCGAIRFLLKKLSLLKWQLVSLKIVLLVIGLNYFCTSCYMLFTRYQITLGTDPEKDEGVREFAILFSLANFAHSFEIGARIGDFDQTNQLKAEYQIQNAYQPLELQSQINDQNREGLNDSFALQIKPSRR